MEPLANAIRLRVLHLCFCVVNIIDGEEELIVVFVSSATVFRPAICHDAEWTYPVLMERLFDKFYLSGGFDETTRIYGRI